jgi:cytochrome c-type biogenesis protein CcmH
VTAARALLTVVAVLAVAAPARASEERPTMAELESETVCPVCGSTVDQSNAPIADRMRAFMRARIAAGDTKSEIKRSLVAEFGPSVVEPAPPKEGFDLLAWLLPALGLAAAAIALGVAAVRWSRRRDGDSGAGPPADPEQNGRPPGDAELERRLDEELARFEG